MLHDLERVLCEIIGMEVRLEEFVCGAVRVREQIVEHVSVPRPGRCSQIARSE